MKAVSAARLKEVWSMAKLKAAAHNATKEERKGKLSPAAAIRIRAKAKRLLGK